MTRKRSSHRDVKIPPQGTWGIYEPEKFREFIETLEICQAFVHSDSLVKTRLAIIILDNLSEVLMYHKGNELIEYDRFHKKVIAAKYSQSDREKFAKDFSGKVWFLSEKEKLLPLDDATVLRIGHAYRNAAFHRDEHNPQANSIIVVLLFATACRLLTRIYYDDTMVGGDRSLERWLKVYGINEKCVEFGPISRHIGSVLQKGIAVSQEEATAVLTKDLNERWRRLIDRVMQKLPQSELKLDEILKTEEFGTQFDHEIAQEPIFEANRLIGQGRPFSLPEYQKRELEYRQTVQTGYSDFKQTLKWNDVKKLKGTFSRLGRQKTPGRMLSVYEELSDRLAKAEYLLISAIQKYEAAAEWASEIARGK